MVICSSLSPAADKLLGMMSLDAGVRGKIQECMIHYAGPVDRSCVEKIKYIVFRVVNAVKAMFGRSEWQVAVRIIAHYRASLNSAQKYKVKQIYDDVMNVVLDYHKNQIDIVPDNVCDLFAVISCESEINKEIKFSGEELNRLPSSVASCLKHIKELISTV